MNIEKVEAAFRTLLHSWGSDTPPEATWAANEMMEAIIHPKPLKHTLLEMYSKECENLTEQEHEDMYTNFFNQIKGN